MATSTLISAAAPGRGRIWLILAWQVIVGISLAVAALTLPTRAGDWNPVLLWGAVALLGAGALASLYAAFALWRRRSIGRVVAVLVDYLAAVLAGILGLHLLGVFLGLNALADTFGAGLPWLLVVFVGYLINAAGDRFDGTPRERVFRQAGNVVMLVGFIAFLYFINTLGGLVWLGGRLIAEPFAALLLVMVAASVAVIRLAWSRPIAEALQASHTQDELLSGYIFLSPNLLGFLLFFAGPLVFSLYISMTTNVAGGGDAFVGFDNYLRVVEFTVQPLSSADQPAREVIDVSRYSEGFRAFGYVVGVRSPRFWIALRNTLQFVLMAVPLSVIPALVLATVLNSKLPGMAIFRAIYFIPSIAAIVGISLVWRWMYDSTIGWINYFVTLATSAVGWNDPRIQWLNLPSTALLAVVIMSAWQTTGSNSVLFLAGLQNVPGELYEAATVDGAGTIAKFFRITLPLLAPTTFFVVSTTIIQALQVFEQVYILTNPPGAPADSTLTLVLYLYQEGFNLFDFGFASAVAWILFAVIFAFTLVQFQRNRQSSVYES